MLRITPSQDAEQAKSYYTEGLAREDYYSEAQELVGRWGGRGAEHLGLRDEVTRDHFTRLVENRHPIRQTKLTARHQGNRRVGYDFNFHCPKSVSVLHAWTQDDVVLRIFQESVRQTMEEIEGEMKTRVRTVGRQDDRTTGNMVWGEFVHFTARPVEGVPDPHLHAHVFVFNATYDSVERRWKAGQFGDLKRDAPYFEAVFHARLAKRLREAGYPIERTPKGWELAGVPEETLARFSRRTAEIEELAEERGIASDRAKDKLGAQTRENKRKGLTMEELRAHWAEQMTAEEKRAMDRVARWKGGYVRPDRSAEGGINHAIAHSFERRSAIREKELLTAALRFGVGAVSPEELKGEVARREAKGSVYAKTLRGEVHVTAPEVLAEERAMLGYARDGRNTCRPLHRNAAQFAAEGLNNEQIRAVRQILSSSDRVMVLQGGAGVGKTTLMKETVRGIQDGGGDTNGKRVFAFAPSAEASRGVLRKEGFAEAETVAALLKNPEIQEKLCGQVIWIDEAGLLGTKTLRRVFELAQRSGARVLLTGDRQQHKSVERGDAFRLLQDRAGIRPARVSKIVRQRGEYREAVESLSRGELVRGFEQLDRLGAIREFKREEPKRHEKNQERDPAHNTETREPRYRPGECHRQLAANYLETVGNGKTALVVAPTHKEGEEVTKIIREGLQERYQLDKEKQRVLATQRRLSWTEAERSDPRRYERGHIVQLHQHVPGIRMGERLIVEGTVRGEAESRVFARNALGQRVTLPLEKADRFQVYEAAAMPVAPGDLVRMTQNGQTLNSGSENKRHRLHNGAVFRVKGFTRDGHLRLENDWIVRKDYGHLTHGYCTTSHSSQGKTVDRVFIAQSSETYPAASQEQFYVSASRGRESVTVYTDDKEELLRAVRRSSERLSATELAEEGQALLAKTRVRKRGTRSRVSPSLEHAVLRARLDAHARTTRRPDGRSAERSTEQSHDRTKGHPSRGTAGPSDGQARGQQGRGRRFGDGRGRGR